MIYPLVLLLLGGFMSGKRYKIINLINTKEGKFEF